MAEIGLSDLCLESLRDAGIVTVSDLLSLDAKELEKTTLKKGPRLKILQYVSAHCK
jgi:DNA-directed RNA polymerase alpha subunit